VHGNHARGEVPQCLAERRVPVRRGGAEVRETEFWNVGQQVANGGIGFV
jgi:hypothetical protein